MRHRLGGYPLWLAVLASGACGVPRARYQAQTALAAQAARRAHQADLALARARADLKAAQTARDQAATRERAASQARDRARDQARDQALAEVARLRAALDRSERERDRGEQRFEASASYHFCRTDGVVGRVVLGPGTLVWPQPPHHEVPSAERPRVGTGPVATPSELVLRRAAAKGLDAIGRCVQKRLRRVRRPMVGAVAVSLHLSAQGRAQRVVLLAPHGDSSLVAACVRPALGALPYPRAGRPVTAIFPFAVYAAPVIASCTHATPGLDSATVKRVLQRHLYQIRYCLGRHPVPGGERRPTRITVTFLLRAAGTMGPRSIKSAANASAEARRCVLQIMRTWRFPKLEGDAFYTTHTFVLHPGAAARPAPRRPRPRRSR